MIFMKDLSLNLHERLQEAFAELHPTVESYLGSLQSKTVPEDTPDSAFTRQAEEALQDYIRRNLAPRPVSGAELKHVVVATSRILVTGCPSIDALLSGGMREGQLTEFVGGTSTGKSQVCMQTAARTALRGERVTYIDTTGNFSRKRLISMAQAAATMHGSSLPPEEVMRNIDVCKCVEIADVNACLTNLEQEIREHPNFGQGIRSETRLLVLDSVAGVISPILGGAPPFEGHTLMMELAVFLKHLAATHHLAVLLTNHMAAVPGGEPRPALGESWCDQPHTRVLLTRTEMPAGEDGFRLAQRHARLSASLLTSLGSPVPFEITADGVLGEDQSHFPVTPAR